MLWVNFLHFYQPPTQKKYWIDRITLESYLPISRHLLANPQMKLTLNVNAVLCELWEKYGHNEVIANLKTVVQRGQVELTGSAKFHPLLPKLPDSEIYRQVFLNELGLNKYFGVFGPLMVRKDSSISTDGSVVIKGFFPPEMAYAPALAKVIKGFGYDWILAEELSYSPKFGEVDYSALHKDVDSGLTVVFRDRYSSFKILSGQLGTPRLFLDEYKGKNVLVTAMDGETFGHHRPGLDKTLAQLYTDSEVKGCSITEYTKTLSEVREVKTYPSTWALMENEAKNGIPFARWEDSANEIQVAQWDLTTLAIEVVNASGSKVEGLEFVQETPWVKARYQLDRSLHSDQYWWASAKPWWSLEMIERGAKELLDAVLLVPDASEEVKTRARDLYFKIITTGFEWQREGKVDELAAKNDEEIMMMIAEDLGKYSKEDLENMIAQQEKEMLELAKNEEFERATHPRNRIRELREYMNKAGNKAGRD